MSQIIRLPVEFKGPPKIESPPIWLPRYPLTYPGRNDEGSTPLSADFYVKAGLSIMEERTASNGDTFALLWPPQGWFFAPYAGEPNAMMQNCFVMKNENSSIRISFSSCDPAQPDALIQPPVDWEDLIGFEKAESELCGRQFFARAFPRFRMARRMLTPEGWYMWADSHEEDDEEVASHSALIDRVGYFRFQGQAEAILYAQDHMMEDIFGDGSAFTRLTLKGRLELNSATEQKIRSMAEAQDKADIAPSAYNYAMNILQQLENGVLIDIQLAAEKIFADNIKNYRDPFLYWNIAAGKATGKVTGPLIDAFGKELPELLRKPIVIENIGRFTPA